MIGEFEEVVLLAIGVLRDNAFGVTIKEEIETRTKREISVGALQVTLRRLEKKGLLTSKHGDTEPSRGGRPKLFFTLTAYGRKALQQSYDVRNEFWTALPKAVLKTR